MGKFSESIGILELTIGTTKVDVTPQMGDNRKVANIITGYQKHKDQARMLKELCDFAYELIVRSDSSLLDDDKQELQLALEMNQMQVMKDILVAFKWTTRKQLEDAENLNGDTIKNLTSGMN